jgi:hypothetical protein
MAWERAGQGGAWRRAVPIESGDGSVRPKEGDEGSLAKLGPQRSQAGPASVENKRKIKWAAL